MNQSAEAISIDPSLIRLLRRESELHAEKAKLESELERLDQKLVQAKAKRPFYDKVLFFLAAAKQREEIIASLQKERKSAQRQVKQAHDRWEPVRASLRKTIAQDLRMTDTSFAKGADIFEFYQRTHKCANDFEKQVQGLIRAIGMTRGAMVAGYDSANKSYSAATDRELALTLQHAESVEESICHFNLVSSEHARMVSGTIYHSASLPKLKPEPYASRISKCSSDTIAEAQATFEELLKSLEFIRDETLPQIHAEIELASKRHDDAALSAVNDQIEVKRKQAQHI